MIGNGLGFNRLCFLYTVFPALLSSKPCFSLHKTLKSCFYSSAPVKTLEDLCRNHNAVKNNVKNCWDVFQKFGCTDEEISKILHHQPMLLKKGLINLRSKLETLRKLGFVGSDLVEIIRCRPRIMSTAFCNGLDRRLKYLETLFGSKQMILKAVVRNPSFLNYDVDKVMKPCVALYEQMGIGNKDLVVLLMCRQTLMQRSSLTQEKLDFLHKIGISKESNMYKYVVSVVAVSRLETIQEKVTNLEKYGFSFEEVMRVFRCAPYIFTLSIDKVQRNMTYIIGTMKLPPSIVLDYPFLLYSNLERWLKPRFVLSEKIRSMGLSPQIQGPPLMRALKMTEPRFLKVFVACHEKDVAELLMDVYMEAKDAPRLAETSRLAKYKGFPF